MNQQSLSNVTINKKDLLAALLENLDKHNQVYAAAYQAYLEKKRETVNKVQGLLSTFIQDSVKSLESLEDLKLNDWHNKLIEIGREFNLEQPVNHAEDYELAITKAEITSLDEFSLTEREFANFIMNKWDWAEKFIVNASSYGTGMMTYSGFTSRAKCLESKR